MIDAAANHLLTHSLRLPTFEKLSTTAVGSVISSLLSDLSMLIMHMFDNLLSAIVLRRHVFTRFMVEKLRSAPADETGIVRTNLKI
jgi:hypothetical protein